MFAYNTSVHTSTGYKPYYLTHGREARVLVDVLVSPQAVHLDLNLSHADFVATLVGRLETAFGSARQFSINAHETQKLYYDVTVLYRPYAVGDLVWLRNPTEDRVKLAPHLKGPYKVLAVMDSNGEIGLTYRIDCPFNPGQERVVHYDSRLTLYHCWWVLRVVRRLHAKCYLNTI